MGSTAPHHISRLIAVRTCSDLAMIHESVARNSSGMQSRKSHALPHQCRVTLERRDMYTPANRALIECRTVLSFCPLWEV